VRAGLKPLPDPDTELYCKSCDSWKPDDLFYRKNDDAYKRRFRAYECKACSNASRKRIRLANIDRERAADRVRKLARRGAPVGPTITCVCGRVVGTPGIGYHRKFCEVFLDRQKAGC
jgi:hypothetical protein